MGDEPPRRHGLGVEGASTGPIGERQSGLVATFKRRSFCPEYRDFSLGLRHRRVDWETTHPNAVQVLHVGPGARGWGLQMKAYADRCSPGGSKHSLKFPAPDMVAAALRKTPLDTGSWRTVAVERALQHSR